MVDKEMLRCSPVPSPRDVVKSLIFGGVLFLYKVSEQFLLSQMPCAAELSACKLMATVRLLGFLRCILS